MGGRWCFWKALPPLLRLFIAFWALDIWWLVHLGLATLTILSNSWVLTCVWIFLGSSFLGNLSQKASGGGVSVVSQDRHLWVVDGYRREREGVGEWGTEVGV